MKKFIIVLVVLVMALTSCNQYFKDRAIEYVKDKGTSTIEVEGCEYLLFITYGGSHVLTHKGNCKNPIHIYKETK